MTVAEIYREEVGEQDEAVGPLSPDMFYPKVSAQEGRMWEHWLPTSNVFDRRLHARPGKIIHRLRVLDAPPEVIREFNWSWRMNLFTVYQIRTPERPGKDPVLLGLAEGEERFSRIAAWGGKFTASGGDYGAGAAKSSGLATCCQTACVDRLVWCRPSARAFVVVGICSMAGRIR